MLGVSESFPVEVMARVSCERGAGLSYIVDGWRVRQLTS